MAFPPDYYPHYSTNCGICIDKANCNCKEPRPPTLSFIEAIHALYAGKKVKPDNDTWKSVRACLELRNGKITWSTSTEEEMKHASISILNINDRWIVVEPPAMIEDVIGALRNGKRIRRRNWSNGLSLAKKSFSNLNTQDLQADDWEICD